MRVTRYTDYSLRVLIYLGLKPSERSTIREISQAYGISKNHLMKVVQQLVSRGFVHSVRGVGGGLTLALAPEQIRIGEVVQAMEPDLDLVECARSDNQCVITPACKLRLMLKSALNSFMEDLNRHSLADVLESPHDQKLAVLLKVESRMPEAVES
jgi:Rrf2 family transcriptional regulator, nitric oxide-sensitive transcriptional repressor